MTRESDVIILIGIIIFYELQNKGPARKTRKISELALGRVM